MRYPSNHQDDETAVRRILAGEHRAFAELLGRYRQSVVRLCVRILGSETEAQDVAQEAALHAFLGLGALREPSRFGAWLHSIAANLARMQLRQRRKLLLESLHQREGYVPPLADTSPGPEQVRLARELHDEVLAALDGLTDLNREAVVGYYLDGHSYAELAAVLGVPVSTVKGRLHKGRRQLAPILGPVARQVLGKEQKKEEMTVEADSEANGMVEVIVEDVLKSSQVGGDYLEALRSGSIRDYHEVGAVRDEGLPGAAVLLRDKDSERVLPIFVGLNDGLAIWRSVAGWEPSRPFTHDLMGQMLGALDLRVKSVAVLRVAEQVFYGEVVLEGASHSAEERRMDARPSDAIALATRAGGHIYVSGAVFEEGGHESKQAYLEARGEELGLR